MTRVVAIDPGRHKCGLVLIDKPRSLVEAGLVLAVHRVMDQLTFGRVPAADLILLGNGTSSEAWDGQLERIAPVRRMDPAPPCARGRYWQLWPPKASTADPQGMRSAWRS